MNQPGACVHGVPLDTVCADCERNESLGAIVTRLDALLRALAQPRILTVNFSYKGEQAKITVTLPGLETSLAEPLSADQLLGVMGVEIEPIGVER